MGSTSQLTVTYLFGSELETIMGDMPDDAEALKYGLCIASLAIAQALTFIDNRDQSEKAEMAISLLITQECPGFNKVLASVLEIFKANQGDFKLPS